MRYKLTIEYDGTPFCGWQSQEKGLSIQQTIENALSICLREQTSLYCSGRTDAGVHAYGQVAHFDCKTPQNESILRDSLNALVRPCPISIKSVEQVNDDFHARFDAKERTYLYRIKNTPYPPVLDANRVWWYKYPLDVNAMNTAAQLLVGKHDFSTFRASGCQAKSPIKTLTKITLWQENDEIQMQVTAPSFLYHQIRNIIGTLSLVGAHKWTIEDFHSALTACDRTKGGPTAPPQGLYFVGVRY